MKTKLFLNKIFNEICNLFTKCGPCRSGPNDKVEMVTQLLFGDLVVINSSKASWLNIRNINDNYEGWIDEKQIQQIDEPEFTRIKKY